MASDGFILLHITSDYFRLLQIASKASPRCYCHLMLTTWCLPPGAIRLPSESTLGLPPLGLPHSDCRSARHLERTALSAPP